MKPGNHYFSGSLVTTDFHRSWLLEVRQHGEGFEGACRSPNGEMFGDQVLYSHPLQAEQALVRLIDCFYACCAMKQLLRELFEADKLPFVEWQNLLHSLNLRLLKSLI